MFQPARDTFAYLRLLSLFEFCCLFVLSNFLVYNTALFLELLAVVEEHSSHDHVCPIIRRGNRALGPVGAMQATQSSRPAPMKNNNPLSMTAGDT